MYILKLISCVGPPNQPVHKYKTKYTYRNIKEMTNPTTRFDGTKLGETNRSQLICKNSLLNGLAS